jgi:thiosulfate/3-mercaptopyruvate sulfurtransferase
MTENLLVTTDWLAAHLNDPDLRIVDIRGHVISAAEPPPHYFNHYDDYVESHIPGAVFVDWVHEITDPDSPYHAQIAPPERFAAVMSRLGIGPATFVVAYDDAHGMFAARLWWSLNYYGHPQVAVLDGGWHKWIAEGRPTTAEMPQITPAAFTPRPNPAIFRDSATIKAHLDDPAQTVIDVRSPDEYAGRASRTDRAGHIPGAVNIPASLLFNADDTLKSPAELREQFADLDPSRPVVTYCNAGVSASLGMLALCAAGFVQVAMYDGSWKAWTSDPANPVATEETP